MPLLYDVVVAHKCRSTHHHIAIAAAMRLDGEAGGRQRDLLLAHHGALLDGAKAPDAVFKDFMNHVYHVGDGGWGGAPEAAARWHAEAVKRLRAKKWAGAAYALGVMSHYYADPIQPFHTAQSEEEGAMHRALEWSIARSFGTIKKRIEARGLPDVPAPEGPTAVEDMVKAGATRAYPHYRTLIDHYDLDAGAKDPPAGLDDTLINIIVDLVAYATAGLARLYASAFEAAAQQPPKQSLTLRGYLAALDIPIEKLAARMDDGAARRQVLEMHEELQRTGKVVKTLPADDKAVRKRHAREVLKVKLKELDKRPLGPIGAKHGQTAAAPEPAAPPVAKREPEAVPRPVSKPKPEPTAVDAPKAATAAPAPGESAAPRPAPVRPVEPATPPAFEKLSLQSDVERAPSIGPKTAAKLAKIGVQTIDDLLNLDPKRAAANLKIRYVGAKAVRDWQDQARLAVDVPSLRAHDAQILVGAGVRNREDLAKASVRELLDAATAFATSKDGAWAARSGQPDEDEVEDWIEAAKAG